MNKKVKLSVKIATVTSSVLFGFAMCATAIANENVTAINNFLKVSNFNYYEPADAPVQDTEYFKSKYDKLADLIADGKAAAQDIEAEGAVLLKNDNNCLPLKPADGENKISLLGISSVDPAYGGKGSAQTRNPQPPVTPEQGFKQAGFSVNSDLISFYSAPTSQKYKRVGRGVDAKINDAPWDDVIAALGDSKIAAYGDAAIFTISRVGGEGTDMAMTGTDGGDGNYLKLSETETSVLRGLANLKEQGKIKKVIVLLNSANQVESEFIYDDAYSIDAALWIGCVGITGFNAVGDIIAGKVNPSGHLTDTFWLRHEYNPTYYNFGDYRYENAENFNLPVSGKSTDKKYTGYVVYQEGIYLGYRYTETRYFDYVTGREKTGDFDYSEVVSHPFGYGGSYTRFEYSDYAVTENADGNYTVSVTVKNVGGVAGKDAVQIYVQKPFDNYDIERGIEKSAVDLVGFAKTNELAPNESQSVSITVDKREFAVYDANDAKTYILTQGEYLVAAGSDAHDAVNNILAYKEKTVANTAGRMDADGDKTLVKGFNLELDKATYSKTENGDITNLFDFADVNKYFTSGENSVKYVTRTDWAGSVSTVNASLKMTQKLADDMIKQDNADDMPTDKREYPVYGKNNGKKLIDLRVDENGDPIPYDHEEWDKLLDQLTWDETVELLNAGLQSTRGVPSIIKPQTVEHNGPTGLTEVYGNNKLGLAARKNDPDKDKTAPYYPCIGIVGSTFSTELAERFGDLLGEDAIWAGYAGFYGVGLNTHRSPYGGRLYEYYGEDGYLTGVMAATQVAALQAHGCNAYIKHFALNEQETQRAGVSVWINEQTLREIYLKPFAMAVTEGGAMNAMAAFNRMGAVHCPANKALLTDFLRGELGMKGLVVSDMYGIGYKAQQMPIFLMAGCDIPDGELDKSAPYKNFRKGHGEVAWQMREAAHRVLYATVQSNAMNSFSVYTVVEKVATDWQIAEITLDCLFGLAFAASAVGAVIVILKDKKSKNNL